MPSELISDLNTPYIPEEDDLAYEEDVKRNPLVVSSWIRYLDYKKEAPQSVRNNIYERAVKHMPRSYKLWHSYLRELVVCVRGRCIVDPSFDIVNKAFERSLIFLDKMPRIWIEYCQFLVSQSKITQSRRTFDRALRALPITQHERIWVLYIDFVMQIGIRETAIRVYRRYLKIDNSKIEDYVEYLIKIQAWREASEQLLNLLNRDHFVSYKSKSKHQLWLQLCDILARHPQETSGIDADPIIRAGIAQFKDQAGKLWTSLADYYTQLAQFDKARDIYEEAMIKVSTARDFSHVWEGYTSFEDSLIAAAQAIVDDAMTNNEDVSDTVLDLEMSLARYERLIERQPLLLSSVLLRQNPHNVAEWHKRVKLYTGNPKMIVDTYAQAVATVDPQHAKGKLYTLWAAFAQYYEAHNKLDQARKIFERATKVPYKTVDDLASLYCEYGEMELRHANYDTALEILRRATISPRRPTHIPDTEPVQKRIWKSLKLWTFYVDLEESYGTFINTKSIYDKMIQLKIVTPQTILNYAEFLEEHKYFEDSFKAYEQGVALFPFPNVQDIWVTYLTKFINRYGGAKLERTRDLFEQVLTKVPPKESKIFYLMYANVEEQFGLARHSMVVYDRATRAVAPEDRFNMYLLYINRTTEFYGLTKTREIYTRAIESLPDDKARDMCIRFADMERKHGEIDRARSIYVHGAQFSDPSTSSIFWKSWIEFEKHHGNEETFTEMLRIKKSVAAQYNQINITNIEMMNQAQKEEIAERIKQQQQIAEMEKKAQQERERVSQPTSSSSTKTNINQSKQPTTIAQQALKNDDEIDIDDEDQDDDDENNDHTTSKFNFEQKQIPASLFSSNIK
ncbi:TPR-like helical domain-containing protein [Heterostelium album PN500]|uniref:TPR-like helical domain-containing protein n=1 Tax=Heterostelium pallidum (strain ATCC 26659 / Pp 5 / PN500) TaxID=670386 RepID=D3B3L3_HETP5|nr:TPR-like helical domain-containing protein [Heterostelium album PN500]EFA83911.1 TPR-like helical domain-containing protein [Heterostelium album PN500]|eukprot:XP_020436028.1 TPR-like helical domain-containing protein [Heterostelium album PN500]